MERIGIVGAGRAGGALARALVAAGWPVVAVASRTAASAERLAASLPAARAVASPRAVADAADLVLLAVPDAAIGPVAAAAVWRPGHAVAHTSGVHSLGPLASAAAAGALVGSLHPLQAFAPVPAADPLAPFVGITCALEGDAALLPRLEALVGALGARSLRLPPEAKPLYHAAAVATSNYLVTLLHLGAELWGAFGAPPDTAVAALLPLVQGALDNVGAHGPARALTGPIARGDVATVAQHLAAIAAARPELAAPYRALGLATLELARANGRLTPEAAAALARLLGEAETGEGTVPRGVRPDDEPQAPARGARPDDEPQSPASRPRGD